MARRPPARWHHARHERPRPKPSCRSSRRTRSARSARRCAASATFPEDYARRKHTAGEPPDGALGRDGREGLPRREPARGVGRRRSRHDGPRDRRRGDRGGGQVAAPDRRLARDRRQHPRPPRHRAAEGALAARHRRGHDEDRLRDHRAGRRHQLAQPRHLRRARAATGSCCAARRPTSRGSSTPTPCWSWRAAACRTARSACRRSRSWTWTRPASPATRSRCPTSAPTSSGRSSSTTSSSRRSA